MLFVKRTLPLIITFITGFIIIAAFFAGPALPGLKSVEDLFSKWLQIIMSFTMLLGAVSLLRINLSKISRKTEGYGYSIVLVVGFLSMALLGLISGSWPMFDQKIAAGQRCYLFDNIGAGHSYVEVVSAKYDTKFVADKYCLMFDNPAAKGEYVHILNVSADGQKVSIIKFSDELKIKESNGKIKKHTLISHVSPSKLQGQQIVIVKLPSGKTKQANVNKLKGSLMAWTYCANHVLFNGIFKAAQATMFSLLAFFVASASFRAFRIKSKEAGLLMGSAFIVMLGNVPIGGIISSWLGFIPLIGPMIDFVAFKEWIMSYPSSAAQSAILIGAMLGYISASMKIILGVERSHLGGGE